MNKFLEYFLGALSFVFVAICTIGIHKVLLALFGREQYFVDPETDAVSTIISYPGDNFLPLALFLIIALGLATIADKIINKFRKK